MKCKFAIPLRLSCLNCISVSYIDSEGKKASLNKIGDYMQRNGYYVQPRYTVGESDINAISAERRESCGDKTIC